MEDEVGDYIIIASDFFDFLAMEDIQIAKKIIEGALNHVIKGGKVIIHRDKSPNPHITAVFTTEEEIQDGIKCINQNQKMLGQECL